MAQLSYVSTGVKQEPDAAFSIPMDESVGAIIFDIGGFEKPFESYPLLYQSFGNGKVQGIKNMDDAQLLGIEDNGFLNGLLYYHLSQFYDYVGGNQTLYIGMADCSKDWNYLVYAHHQISGRAFQYGIWTSQPLWRIKDDGKTGFTPLITDIQREADEINGRVGSASHTMTPASFILSANSNHCEGPVDFRRLPDALELQCPKVSVLLAQNGSPEVHAMQKNNPLEAPVGIIGMAMACLALCGAEESIASVKKCDLNKNEGFNYPEWGFGENGTPMDDVHRIWTNTVSSRGYIMPVSYDGIEASYFLSSDQTLSEGDYGSIANNRVMHKCRRAASTALVPYINSNHVYSPGFKNISPASVSIMSDAITTVMDTVMRNRNGQKQIEGRVVTFLENDKLLENDTLSIRLDILPVNYSGYISEEVSHDIEK